MDAVIFELGQTSVQHLEEEVMSYSTHTIATIIKIASVPFDAGFWL